MLEAAMASELELQETPKSVAFSGTVKLLLECTDAAVNDNLLAAA